MATIGAAATRPWISSDTAVRPANACWTTSKWPASGSGCPGCAARLNSCRPLLSISTMLFQCGLSACSRRATSAKRSMSPCASTSEWRTPSSAAMAMRISRSTACDRLRARTRRSRSSASRSRCRVPPQEQAGQHQRGHDNRHHQRDEMSADRAHWPRPALTPGSLQEAETGKPAGEARPTESRCVGVKQMKSRRRPPGLCSVRLPRRRRRRGRSGTGRARARAW